MKVFTTITKKEIEEAVLKYLEDKIEPAYRYKYDGEITLNFTNKDGDIGYFECHSEAVIVGKESS